MRTTALTAGWTRMRCGSSRTEDGAAAAAAAAGSDARLQLAGAVRDESDCNGQQITTTAVCPLIHSTHS